MQIIDVESVANLDIETKLKIFNLLIEELCICSVEKASQILMISKQALYRKKIIEIDKIKLVPVNVILAEK